MKSLALFAALHAGPPPLTVTAERLLELARSEKLAVIDNQGASVPRDAYRTLLDQYSRKAKSAYCADDVDTEYRLDARYAECTLKLIDQASGSALIIFMYVALPGGPHSVAQLQDGKASIVLDQ